MTKYTMRYIVNNKHWEIGYYNKSSFVVVNIFKD